MVTKGEKRIMVVEARMI